MDQQVELSVETAEVEAPRAAMRNDRARVGSTFGIVGAVFVVGTLALMASAVITAFTTPDFMPGDITDDPFVGAGLACVFPIIFGFIGLPYAISGARAVSWFGEEKIAILGLVLGIVNVLVPIAVAVVAMQFDQQVATCGGG
jgi:hypothetical protein